MARINISQILMKRGNTTAANTYVGPLGELLVDTGLKTIRVQDGVTPGGMSTLATNVQLQALGTYANATFGTSSYGNANVALYLSTSSIISNINANITAANAAITSLQSNAAIQASLLDTLTGNAATQSTVLDTLTANAATQATTLSNLLGNAVAQQTSLTDLVANAATQAELIANAGGTYANANVASYLPTYTGNIAGNIVKNGYTWTFGTDGNLTLPGGGAIDGSDYDVDITAGNDGVSTFGHISFTANGPNGLNSLTYNSLGEITVVTAGANDGLIKWVGNSSGDGAGYTTMTMVPDTTREGTDQYIIIDPTGGEPGHIHLRAGGTQDASGADLYLGGELTCVRVSDTSGIVTVRTTNIGDPNITMNWSFQQDGNLYFPGIGNHRIGESEPGLVASSSDAVVLQSNNNGESAEWFFDTAGNLTIPGNITMGAGSGRLISVVTPEPGLVSWEFGMDGNLTIPGNINYANGTSILSGIGGAVNGNIVVGDSQIQFVANSSGDGYGLSTIRLVPYTPGYDSAIIIIDPTYPNHIHMRAGFEQDNAAANLFLGGEASHFNVEEGANPNVSIRSNYYTWTFATDGRLQLPEIGEGSSEIFTGSGGISIKSPQYTELRYSSTDPGNVSPTLNTEGYIWITNDGAHIQNYHGGQFNLEWLFGTDGNLTIPGSINGANVISAGTFVSNAFNVVTAGNLSITSQYGLGTTGTILEDNGTLELIGSGAGGVYAGWDSTYGNGLGNIATISFNEVGGEGILLRTGNRAATEYNWNFDKTGNLTFPTGGSVTFDASAVSTIDGVTNINAVGTIGANVVQVLDSITSFGASPAPTISGFRSISTTGSAANEGNISASGNLVASQNAYVTGNVFAAQYNYANGVSISQSIQNGISNVRVLSSGGLVSINVGGASNIALFTTTGASIGGTLSTSGFTATGAVTLATASGNINIGASQTTGHVNMGGTAQTGTILIGQSTYSQTINIGHGITGSGNTKTIQIGENGAAGSATLIDIGPATASATGTVTFNTGTVVTIANTGSNALSVAGNITGGNVTAAQYNFANGVNILSTVGAGSYGNTEVAAYLPAYTGNVGAARVQVTNAVDFMYGGFPYMGWQLSGSDTLKLRTNIASGDYTNDAIIVDRQSLAVNVVATLTTGNIITTSGLFWANGTAYSTGGGTYGNTEVAAYLPTYIGNVGAGNVNVTSTVYAANIVTSGTSGNISGVNVISANTFVFASNGVNILSAAGGGTYGNTEVAAYLLTWPNIDSNILDATSANITTLRAPNFNSANAVISGGYISALTNASIITATITTLNSTGGNITTLRATNFGTANAVITGGYINSLANLTATTAVLTNLSTGNAVISGGYISALTNAYITTSAITNFSTANAVITGGYASGLANVTVTGNVTAGNLIGYGSNTSITAGTYTSTFDNVGMVTVPNLTVSGSVDATSITTDSLTINDTGWTNFTPTWYAGTGTNSVGDGLAEGRYRQLGKTVEVWMQITMGSTTTFGTGEYKVSLPVASRMLGSAVLSLVMIDTGTRLYNSLAHNAYTTTLFHTSSNVTLFWDTGVVTNTSPFTWTNGDFFVIAGTYEAS